MRKVDGVLEDGAVGGVKLELAVHGVPVGAGKLGDKGQGGPRVRGQVLVAVEEPDEAGLLGDVEGLEERALGQRLASAVGGHLAQHAAAIERPAVVAAHHRGGAPVGGAGHPACGEGCTSVGARVLQAAHRAVLVAEQHQLQAQQLRRHGLVADLV